MLDMAVETADAVSARIRVYGGVIAAFRIPDAEDPEGIVLIPPLTDWAGYPICHRVEELISPDMLDSAHRMAIEAIRNARGG